jgi:myosin heavy subunit
LTLGDTSSDCKTSQSLIVSGESGAGKTEATKLVMKYLTGLTASFDPSAPKSTLSDQVLSSNPLLEAFGNAKTLRNENSSRFGKFIEIQFDVEGKIVGAQITNYLLEKIRLVGQREGERNYHVFYQVVSGCEDPAVKETMLRGEGVKNFNYLSQSGCYKANGVDDTADFKVLCACMEAIDLTKDDIQNVLKTVATVLCLGNIDITDDESGQAKLVGNDGKRKFSSEATMALVAENLGLDPERLQECMLHRYLSVEGKKIKQEQSGCQAVDKRDSLAKAIYSWLFMWLVERLNDTMSAEERWGFIGLLDIYGFEVFQKNSFEQFCINYANEVLQRHFNQHIFEMEQQEYEREDIDWSYIEFQDNLPCIELIEAKPNGKPGILQSLDDVWRMKGNEANMKFVSKLHNDHDNTQV